MAHPECRSFPERARAGGVRSWRKQAYGNPGGIKVDAPGGNPIGCALNVFWLVVAGVWIFLSHLGLALSLAVTIIGIPFAIQHVKLAMLALAPFGTRVRET